MKKENSSGYASLSPDVNAIYPTHLPHFPLSREIINKYMELDELVRDLTRVGSIPKSEARRRIQQFLQEQRQRMAKRIEKRRLDEFTEDIKPPYRVLPQATRNECISFNSGLQAALNIVLGEGEKI